MGVLGVSDSCIRLSSPMKYPIGAYLCPLVSISTTDASLDTTGRRIFINDIEFADYNGDGIAKNFLNNAGVSLKGFNREVLRQVELRLI